MILYFNYSADIWAQLVLVCCCFWNYNSYQPGCCYRWAHGPRSRRGYVYGGPTHTLHAKEMAGQRKYWEGPQGVWNLISGIQMKFMQVYNRVLIYFNCSMVFCDAVYWNDVTWGDGINFPHSIPAFVCCPEGIHFNSW